MSKNKINECLSELKEINDEGKETEIIVILQNMCRIILEEYYLQIDDITIKPILVEAYYYNERVFRDENSHKAEKQKNNKGNIYIHEKGYGGVDICFSDNNDYYLSFLIKNSVATFPEKESGKERTVFLSQTALYDYIKSNVGFVYESNVELKKPIEVAGNKVKVEIDETECGNIVFVKRKGLTKESYKDEELAAFPLEMLKKYHLTLAKGCGREQAVKNYLEANYTTEELYKEDKWAGFCRDYLGYNLKSYIKAKFAKK